MRHYINMTVILFCFLTGCAQTIGTYGSAQGEVVDPYTHTVVATSSVSGGDAMAQAGQFVEHAGNYQMKASLGRVYATWAATPFYMNATAANMLTGNGWANGTPGRSGTGNAKLDAFRKTLIDDCVAGKRGTKDECMKKVDTKLYSDAQLPSPPTGPSVPTHVVPPPEQTPTTKSAALPPVESKEVRAEWERVNREIAASVDADELSDAVARIPNVLASEERNVNPALAQLAADVSTWIASWKSDLERAELAPLRIIIRRMAASHFQVNEDFLGALNALRGEADKNRIDASQSEKLRALAGRVVASIDHATGREPEKKVTTKKGVL
jgi:hypothetical protein